MKKLLKPYISKGEVKSQGLLNKLKTLNETLPKICIIYGNKPFFCNSGSSHILKYHRYYYKRQKPQRKDIC